MGARGTVRLWGQLGSGVCLGHVGLPLYVSASHLGKGFIREDTPGLRKEIHAVFRRQSVFQRAWGIIPPTSSLKGQRLGLGQRSQRQLFASEQRRGKSRPEPSTFPWSPALGSPQLLPQWTPDLDHLSEQPCPSSKEMSPLPGRAGQGMVLGGALQALSSRDECEASVVLKVGRHSHAPCPLGLGSGVRERGPSAGGAHWTARKFIHSLHIHLPSVLINTTCQANLLSPRGDGVPDGLLPHPRTPAGWTGSLFMRFVTPPGRSETPTGTCSEDPAGGTAPP